MMERLKGNRTASIWIASAVGVFFIVTTLGACQVDDFVKVDVPKDVAESIEVEDRIPLSKSDAAWSEWIAYVDRNSERFAAEIDRGREVSGMIQSLTDTGIRLGTDAASTLPGGALITSGIALMGGLFLRRPGDAKREQKEKEASFKAGLEKGQSISESLEEAIQTMTGQTNENPTE